MSRRFAKAAAAAGLVGAASVAAFMRLYRPDLAVFGGDQAWHMRQAVGIARGEALPAYGLGSSAGVSPPALYDYLLTPAALVSWRLEPATLWMGLLALGGWAATVWMLRRHFGPAAALAGGWLYAGSLWASFFGRIVNGQTLIPLFSALFGWSMLEVLRSGSRRHQLLAPIWLLAAIWSHYAALSLLAPAFLGWLLARRRVDLRRVAVGVLLGLALAGPYWLDEARSGFAQARALVARPGVERAEPQLVAWTLGQHLTRIADLGPSMGHPLGDVFFPEPRWALALSEAQNWMLVASVGVLLTAGLVGGPTRHRRGLWVTGWYLLPPGVLALSPVQLQIHNLLVVYPAAFVTLGAAAGMAWEWAKRLSHLARAAALGAGVLLVSLVCLVQVVAWPGFLGWLERAVSPFPGPMWFTWTRLERESRAIAGDGAGKGWVLALREGLREPAEYVWGGGGRLPVVDPYHQLVLPEAGPQLYLVARGESPALEELVLHLGGKTLGRVSYALDHEHLAILRVPGGPEARLTALPAYTELDWRLANGVRFLGYAVQKREAGPRILLVWRAEEGTEDLAAHSVFMHLLDAAGGAVAKVDLSAPAWAGSGGTVLSFAQLTPPAGTEVRFLSLGMYRLPEVRIVPGGARRDPPTAADLRIPLSSTLTR